MGQSIGTGPTVQVAYQYPGLHKVILISPYKSLPKMMSSPD